MTKINIEDIKHSSFIFPIIFKKGLLFRDKDVFYLFENHVISKYTIDEIQNEVENGMELTIPDCDDDVILLKQGVDFVYNRLLSSQLNSDVQIELLNVLKNMKIKQELIAKDIQKELL